MVTVVSIPSSRARARSSGQRAVEQRLAAGDRELPVAEAGSGLEAVREELQRELPSDRRS